MSDTIPYDSMADVFAFSGSMAGLDGLVTYLRDTGKHHAHFRALLLRKRFELGLPLVNPGELRGYPAHVRKTYEDYVEEICRQTGERYIADGDIAQAWRYLRTIGEREPVKKALAELPASEVTDEVLGIAIQEGVHPVRGFELLLEVHGLCRAISVYDQQFSPALPDRKRVAGLLVKRLYRDLVLSVRRDIQERKLPPPSETDLVDLVRGRPMLFDKANSHADPEHVWAIARIGVIVEAQDEMLMALSICEYGKLLAAHHAPAGAPPFESGYADCARYMRALLGQDVEKTVEWFCGRLGGYSSQDLQREAVELVVSLLWRVDRREEALNIWQNFMRDMPPDAEGTCIPSFYELCIQAGDAQRMADTARRNNDIAAWAAANVMRSEQSKIAAQGGAPAAGSGLRSTPAGEGELS